MTNVDVILRFERRDVAISLNPDGADITLREGTYHGNPGGPAIPGKMVEVALPPGRRATKVDAKILSSLNLLDEPVFIRPQMAPGISSIDKPMFGQDKDLQRNLRVESTIAPRRKHVAPETGKYEIVKDDPVAELCGMNHMGGIPIVSIYVRPIQIDQYGNLHLLSSIEITITTVSDENMRVRNALHRNPRSIRYQEVASALVINPEKISVVDTSEDKNSETSGTGGTSGGMPPGSGLGGTLPGLSPIPPGAGPKHVDYLIIADNHTWNPTSFSPDQSLGDLITAFSPLLNHKRKRGLRTHLATITDIVSGVYGDHRTGTRDLQECLRRFLQAYTYSRGVQWVLLGGDTEIVPIRYVCGSDAHGLFGQASVTPSSSPAGEKVPKAGEYVWKNTFLALRLADNVNKDPNQIGQPDHILTMFKSGTLVPKVNLPSGNDICWFYTDDTWTTPSTVITSYIRVNGPADIINDEPQWYTNDNLLPTDLYYSSLFGPNDLKPGCHDWDLLGNGLYGQWSRDKNLGGVDYSPDISVGRAPVSDLDGVKTFVSKIISYETADTRSSEYNHFKRMLLVAEHWDHCAASVKRGPVDSVVPGKWTYQYSYDPNKGRSIVRAECLLEGNFPQLLAYLQGGDRRVIPYDHSGAARGWHYAKSDTDLSPSVSEFFLPFVHFHITIPIRTEFVVIRSPDYSELTPDSYFFDPNGLDGSIADTEQIREYIQCTNPRISQIERIYTDEEDLDALSSASCPVTHFSPQAVIDAMNMGPHLVALSGHGNWPGCCGVDTNMAPGLSNGSRTSIIFADSCLTAQIDVKDVECLGEVISSKTTTGGAVAFMGFTRWGWIGTGSLFQHDFFKQLGTQRHLGLMVDAGRRMWVEGRYGRWHALSTIVLGCPEMPIFRDDNDVKPYFVGNLRTKELHERFCPWVERMSLSNRQRFFDKNIALNAGFDGCGFCMREYHHR